MRRDNAPPRRRCPANGCHYGIPESVLMCRFHWRMVPSDMQGAVYATWGERVKRPDDDNARGAHLAAANLAIDAVNEKLAARSAP